MNHTFLKLVGSGLLSLVLSAAVLGSSASAQVDDALAPAPVVADDDDDDFDWGWLGLLGLLGLGGLMRRDRHHDDRRHTTVGTSPRADATH